MALLAGVLGILFVVPADRRQLEEREEGHTFVVGTGIHMNLIVALCYIMASFVQHR